MSHTLSLNALWNSAVSTNCTFQPDDYSQLPSAAQRYLEHAIAPGTTLAMAVRLRMHGEIKLKGWLPFKAEEVLCWQRGFIWKATVWMNGLPIGGSDRLVDGEAAMRWKLLGLLPVMTAGGPDIARSGVGRMQGEAVWLPSVLCSHDVVWAAADASHPQATLTTLGEPTTLRLSIGPKGQLECCQYPRWGNPNGAEFSYTAFGGLVEEEGSFGGYTIPTRLRLGWYFGSDSTEATSDAHRFESEGEFFRVTIDDAIYQ